jgi:kinetochore protein Mis12/MTW1
MTRREHAHVTVSLLAHTIMSSPGPAAGADGLSAQQLPEALGFEPQFLLDDLFNVAQSAAVAATGAMEGYLARFSGGGVSAADAEQGAVALQTLLDTHVDQALDFFEMWAKRNIFVLPADAPLVMPHHKGLDLNVREGAEAELLAEIEELRRKKENVSSMVCMYR